MDLEFSPEDIAFRNEVRAFIDANYPAHLKGRVLREDLSKEDFLAWHKILGQEGLVAPSWPKEYGGTGWTATQKYIWLEENARADTIPPLPFGVSMVGPVIYTFGTDEQKKALPAGHPLRRRLVVPRLFRARRGLRPRVAEDHGRARRRLLHRQRPEDLDDARPVRRLGLLPGAAPTRSAKQQEGISFLLIDMKTPGVTVRPIISAGRRPRGQRRLPRQREGAGR